MKAHWICILSLSVCSYAGAQQPGGDPLKRLLIAPEIVVHRGTEIGLSKEQVTDFRRRLEEAGRQVQQVQRRSNQAMGRLAELLSADKVDEEAAVKQLDQLLNLEKEHKHIHLRVMIQIRNDLTPEQRQAAMKLAQAAKTNGGLEQRLKAKLSQIEHVVQERSAAGQPPFDAVGLMQKFPELMQKGQVDQAEALLDRVVAMLGGNKQQQAGRGPATLQFRVTRKIQRVQRRAQQMQQNGDDVSEIQALMTQVPDLMRQGKVDEVERLLEQALQKAGEDIDQIKDDQSHHDPTNTLPKQYSPREIRDEVEQLKKEDVAWRKIEWKTCLLDGLTASREQNKPIMLWIFIDRPIDDERC